MVSSYNYIGPDHRLGWLPPLYRRDETRLNEHSCSMALVDSVNEISLIKRKELMGGVGGSFVVVSSST